ncbi:MAG: two pore domain potassium channel family protein [Gammaproteobacteria bacterium]|nr:MAG: two pore domain potassium channel family protein [Gammaproteobacteria bacterium]
MLTNLLLGLPTMVLCLMLQTGLLVMVIRYFLKHRNEVNMASLWSSLLVINGVMLLLVIGNLGQIAIWALLFRLLGEFQQFDDAFYHSAVNFGSLGYGDIVMSDEYKLLGALEAINGVLMIGVSTAALMSIFQGATKKFIAARGEQIIK